ncbi:MAG: hypothetical protein ACJAQ6_001384 [Arenicella sp.]
MQIKGLITEQAKVFWISLLIEFVMLKPMLTYGGMGRANIHFLLPPFD